jgi:hypothetical protein
MSWPSLYRPKPTRYSANSEMLQAKKLAKPRGRRSFMNVSTSGSSRKAIIAAMVTVMKKTRP